VGDKVLNAMAQAYPDSVDPYLLAMVLGCDTATLSATMDALVTAGLAQARVLIEGAEPRLQAPCITEKGLTVAGGRAGDATEAAAALHRVEAATLRRLLALRIGASRMAASQVVELQGALDTIDDRVLVDAGAVLAHQSVSEWNALLGMLHARMADQAIQARSAIPGQPAFSNK
jgi:hypothetical protein